jgi:hypothetical protein
MTVDQLKAEARSKPSGVAFRKLSTTVYISVKIHCYPNSCTNDRYEWTCGGSTISESRAGEILNTIEN